MADESESVEEQVKRRLSELQHQASKQARDNHRMSEILSERVATYYRQLLRREVPEALAFQLVASYHQRQIETLLQPSLILYVPVPEDVRSSG